MPLPAPRVRLPKERSPRPLVAILRRVAIALAVVLVNWAVVLLERDDYTDSQDGHVSATDALYYTTVTLSTTGYGDITPVTESARLVNALLVTPMRLLFVIILVGTTITALTERSREDIRLARWRRRVHDHVVVLGYGTKGRSAVRELLRKGCPHAQIVVVDTDQAAIEDATHYGLHAVLGSATAQKTHEKALVQRARVVIVALHKDDAAVLATLTARRVNPDVLIIASAREAENADLLQQSGAASVIVSSETTGRMLGIATESPQTVAVAEDLLQAGTGLDLLEREVTPLEVGLEPSALPMPVLAVVRGGRTLNYNASDVGTLQTGDRIVHVLAMEEPPDGFL